MKRYSVLIILVVALLTIVVAIRYSPTRTIVIDRQTTETVYDTIKIIETPKGERFKARRIELNRADSASLVGVYGVGSVLQARIIDYRQRLGGFHTKEQLMEVKGITKEVYHNIEANFWVDTLAIRKIMLNFATRKQLIEHPYISPNMAGRIVGATQMKGGYSTLRQLLTEDILLPQEARRIAPYVAFDRPK